MRKFATIRFGLLLPVLVVCIGPKAYAGPATQPAIAQPGQGNWSETLNGLRVRLSAPDGTTCRDNALLPLLVEVQNNGDGTIAYSELWRMVRVLARDGDGKWLGIPYMGPQLGDWAARTGSLAPGQITEMKISFQSLRFNRTPKAGETIQLQVSAPTQHQRPGKLPLEVNSPAVSIRIDNAFPQPLREADVAPDWHMDLACERVIGLLGSQTLHVDDKGAATLVEDMRQYGKPGNRRLTVVLSADRLHELAVELRKMEVWKLGGVKGEPGVPDGGIIRIALVGPSGGSVVGEFAGQQESDQPIVRDLRQVIERLIGEVEATDTGPGR